MLGRGIGSCILCFLFPEPIPVTPSGCFGWKKEGWIFFCGLTIPTLALVRSGLLFSSGEENALKCSALFEHSFPFLPDRHKEPLRGPRARLVCLLDMAHREAEAELAPSPLSSQELGIVLLSPPPPPHLLLPLTSSFLSSCSSFFSPLLFSYCPEAQQTRTIWGVLPSSWSALHGHLLPEEDKHSQPLGLLMSTRVS